MRFAGHERDLVSGLDMMHARYYAPWGGRFLSVDPGRDYDFKSPQSFNLYAYVRNNPASATDPNGRWLVLAGSKGDVAYLRGLLVGLAMRPRGRELVNALGRAADFRVELVVASLNKDAIWAAFRRREPNVPFDFGRTKASYKGGVRGALVLFDRAAIQDPGRNTGHANGLITTGHELGSHVTDLRAGKSTEAIQLTDDKGIAEQIGREYANEKPDISRDQAERVVEELLALGAELEKALVKVTPETNVATGETKQ
ncbi:MAG: hypothetical protein KatS3mg007_2202 [Thermoanaerobaculum sp.]|nr:MAG: hypothetical protein KatS3mg007_2202 [Thermoanaerobaculum sp.]